MHYSPVQLHIPDGFLSFAISIFCWVVTVAILRMAISRTNKSLGEKQVPLMGIMAAFIFAAQMINFPVAGGTSGHLLGGALAAQRYGLDVLEAAGDFESTRGIARATADGRKASGCPTSRTCSSGIAARA